MDHACFCRVGGFQGCSQDKQGNKWRCARPVRKRPRSVPVGTSRRRHWFGYLEMICLHSCPKPLGNSMFCRCCPLASLPCWVPACLTLSQFHDSEVRRPLTITDAGNVSHAQGFGRTPRATHRHFQGILPLIVSSSWSKHPRL